MQLSTSQLQTLKTWLTANASGLDDEAAAAALNALAAGPFIVWRGPATAVTPAEYKGPSGVVWTAVDTLTVGKARIFEWLTGDLSTSINPSDTNARQGIADAFGGASQTTTNLTALAKRSATVGEKLFANGTGTTGSPATMELVNGVYAEGPITAQNVSEARNQP